jgi:rRNA maturation endonuclease Nob1
MRLQANNPITPIPKAYTQKHVTANLGRYTNDFTFPSLAELRKNIHTYPSYIQSIINCPQFKRCSTCKRTFNGNLSKCPYCNKK